MLVISIVESSEISRSLRNGIFGFRIVYCKIRIVYSENIKDILSFFTIRMELSDQAEEAARRRLSSNRLTDMRNIKVTKDDVETARKMFLGGLPLLPWLWICAALFFRTKWSRGKSSANHDQLCVYYNRYLVGSSIYAVLLVIWVIIFQTSYESLDMKSLLVNALSSGGGWQTE